MGTRIFKNIYGKDINVNAKLLVNNGIIKVVEMTQEITNLVRCGYLKEVNQTKVSGTLK